MVSWFDVEGNLLFDHLERDVFFGFPDFVQFVRIHTSHKVAF